MALKPISRIAAGVQASTTLAIDSLFKQMKAEGKDVVGFGAGEPDFPTPEHIKQAGIEAIENNYTKYTPAAGLMELREAACYLSLIHILNSGILIDIGIWAFALSTVFQLVTLPVEINASNRALAAIEQGGLLTEDEYPMAKKTLTAAAMTYVAALAVSLCLLYTSCDGRRAGQDAGRAGVGAH